MFFSNFQIQCFCTSKRNNVELHSVSPSTDLSPKTSPTDSTNKIDDEVSDYRDYNAVKSDTIDCLFNARGVNKKFQL